MKILITGAGGWLGSELTKRVLEDGDFVRALVLFTSDSLKTLKDKYGERLEIIEGDICNEKIVNESLKEIDIVYHLAAKVHSVPNNEKDEEEFFKINTYDSELIFKKCIKNNVKRVIFYSSVSVYGNHVGVVNINTPKRPVTTYAKSKFKAEQIGLDYYKKEGLPITIIQPVTVYGGDDVGNFEKIKKLAKKGVLIRFGDGNNKKTIIYYKDLITMTKNIAKDYSQIGKCIICGSESISINEINNVFEKNMKKKYFKLYINASISEVLINIFKFINISKIRNISRQISVLKTSSNFNINSCEKYCSDLKKFKNFYDFKGDGL